MKIYLSGPMTGLPDLNYPAFRDAARLLRGMEHVVYNPAEWEEMNGGIAFDITHAFLDYTAWIICEADAVVTLPGWENSPGATAETALARAIRKPVFPMPRLGETFFAAEQRVQPPECVNHNEAQKRDGNPPWCSWCGWRREVKAEPARKVGQSADERSAGAKHVPWNHETGYGVQHPVVNTGWPRPE